MLRVILTMGIAATLYAGFALFFRNKRCAGNCAGCGNECHKFGGPHDDR